MKEQVLIASGES